MSMGDMGPPCRELNLGASELVAHTFICWAIFLALPYFSDTICLFRLAWLSSSLQDPSVSTLLHWVAEVPIMDPRDLNKVLMLTQQVLSHWAILSSPSINYQGFPPWQLPSIMCGDVLVFSELNSVSVHIKVTRNTKAQLSEGALCKVWR